MKQKQVRLLKIFRKMIASLSRTGSKQAQNEATMYMHVETRNMDPGPKRELSREAVATVRKSVGPSADDSA